LPGGLVPPGAIRTRAARVSRSVRRECSPWRPCWTSMPTTASPRSKTPRFWSWCPSVGSAAQHRFGGRHAFCRCLGGHGGSGWIRGRAARASDL